MSKTDPPFDAQVPILEIRDVTVQRGNTRILNRLHLTISQGGHTAILGPNGAGKTSLLRLLTRHFYPSVEEDGSTGSCKILGQESWNVADLRRNMGIVSATLDQNFARGRTGRMSVEQAVASGINSTELAEFGVRFTDEIRSSVQACLKQVEASHLAVRTTETLSTGERRRVLIARALIHQPRILVLDEPTTGLDIVARHYFTNLLTQLTQIPNLTLVLVTHHVDEIIPQCTRVVMLKAGRVVFDGPRPSALSNAELSALFDTNIQVRTSPSGVCHAHIP